MRHYQTPIWLETGDIWKWPLLWEVGIAQLPAMSMCIYQAGGVGPRNIAEFKGDNVMS